MNVPDGSATIRGSRTRPRPMVTTDPTSTAVQGSGCISIWSSELRVVFACATGRALTTNIGFSRWCRQKERQSSGPEASQEAVRILARIRSSHLKVGKPAPYRMRRIRPHPFLCRLQCRDPWDLAPCKTTACLTLNNSHGSSMLSMFPFRHSPCFI
jgi:hypothetical protein